MKTQHGAPGQFPDRVPTTAVRASDQERETTIHAATIFGDVQLLVPEGVGVEVRSWTPFGGVRQEAGMARRPVRRG